MEKEEFATSSWLAAPEISYGLAPLRVSLGEAFGWSDSAWFSQRARLEEVYDYLQYQQSALLSELDQATQDEQRQQWLQKVADSKRPREPIAQALPEPVEDKPQAPTGAFAAKTALPSIAHLTAMEQILMEGALQKSTVDEAVRQIYDNMHKKTGWMYNASVRDINGDAYIKGANASGMCESYRNAFAAALQCYDTLRATHPVEAVKTAPLTIEPDNSLAAIRFCTHEGLTLMGNGLKGNVYLEVDGRGAITARGTDGINKFVFFGHWTLKVNGVVYDPIFYSIGEDNIGMRLNMRYEGPDGGRFLPNIALPVPSGEFGATFIYVSDWAEFQGTVTTMANLYKENQKEVDGILDGSMTLQVRRRDRVCYTTAKALLKDNVANMSIFLKVVQEGTQTFKASDATAVDKILQLAAKR